MATMTTIPLDTHPHILDAILAHAPYESLIALRAASRYLRDRIDVTIVPHIAFLAADLRAVWEGKHVRIPRADWWDVPALADAVRIVDLCGAVPGKKRRKRARTGRCWCGGPIGDRRATKLHRVQVLRQWTREHHLCAEIAAPRIVTFIAPGRADYGKPPHRVTAPVSVFHCASGSLRCDVAGVDDVVIRAQPSEWNDFDATIVSLDVARVLARCERCTLVGWAELPVLRRRWFCVDGFFPTLAHLVALELVREHYVEYEEAPDLIAEHLRMITEDEYRAEIGEELFALEAYCAPPSGAGW